MRLPNDTDGIGEFECDPTALELVPNGQAWRSTDLVPPACGNCAHPSESFTLTEDDARRCRICRCRDHWPMYDSVNAQTSLDRATRRRQKLDRERKREAASLKKNLLRPAPHFV